MSTVVLDFDLERDHRVEGPPPDATCVARGPRPSPHATYIARGPRLDRYDDALVLVRFRGRPVHQLTLPVVSGYVCADEIRRSVCDADASSLWDRWLETFLERETPVRAPVLPATVAVCTRDRPEDLRRCLDSLAGFAEEGHEVLVIDNAPATDESQRIVAARGFARYIREDRPGASAARNRALREASHEIVAFSDDDAAADPGWLPALLGNFHDPLVLCVTGLTMPRELETDAQRWFERYSPFGRGLERKVYDGADVNPLSAWRAGASVNMAVRRAVLGRVGAFNEALGPGTRSRTGEDYELFARILAAGYRIVYDPAALSWHSHRRTWTELRRVLRAYGTGAYAAWTHLLLADRELVVPNLALAWLLRTQLPNLLRSVLRRPGSIPADLVLAELGGCLAGPWAYVSARRALRRPDQETDEYEDEDDHEYEYERGPRRDSCSYSSSFSSSYSSVLVSIVIPTRDRCDILRRTLAALARQSVPADAMEVIVAADGCTDDTLALVADAHVPYRLVCVQLPGRGAAAARNAGAKAASGEILLFLDDDIEPAPGLVAAHLRSHAGNADVVAIGPCPPLLHGRQDFWRVLLRRWWFDVFTAMAEPGHRFTYRDVLTGNLSMRRTLFERVGGFDAAFGVDVSHEDWELGIRLLDAGARLTYVEGAMAWHHDRTDLDRSYRRARQDGKGDVMIGRLHPELRPALPLATGGPAPRPVERAVRSLAFNAPGTGDALARLSRRALDGLEWLRLRRAWRRLNGTARRYWYWRGVAEGLRSPEELGRFLAYCGSGAAGAQSEPDIDLAAGLADAERRLDAERPAAARFRFGDGVVRRVPPVPGAEPLRGAHLRPLIGRRFGTSLLDAAAIEAVVTNRGRHGPPRSAQGPNVEACGANACERASAPIVATRAGRLDAPHLVAELDLTGGLHGLDVPPGYGSARVLVRARRRLIGWVRISPLSPPRLSALELRTAITEQLGPALRRSLVGDAGDAGGTTPRRVGHCPPVTVVVCTRDRTERLARCLRALLELDYPAYEVVVIDNAPSDDRTARLAAELGVRYVREDVPGLDRARNRGIRAARHEIIAFTDDDVRADRGWLREVAAAFADPETMAVTGFVAPDTLDTRAEQLFELEYGGMSHGIRPRTFRRSELRNAQLLWASAIGCGANMAFRRRVFDAAGCFDVALDVGTLAGGAGDVEMLHRTVVSGHTAAYWPAALVWHSHRRTLPALRRQLFDNGRSFGAYLVTCFRRRTVPRHAILRFAVQDWFARWMLRRLIRPGPFPRGLVIAEMTGAILSPFFYLGAQWQKRRRPDAPASAEPDAPAAHAGDEGGDALEPAMTANA